MHMETLWGVCVILLGLVAWLGQLICAIAPNMGARLGLGDAESDVDPVFYIDERGEAIWDAMILWLFPLAGVLLLTQHPYWPQVAILGGGIYLYFAGRSLLTRRMMQKRGVSIGTPRNIKTGYLFLMLWAVAAVITIGMGMTALAGPT